MALLSTEKGKKIVEQVTLKNVKLNIGHDLAGMYADVYFKGKKIGYYNDDGYGGETDIVYNNKAVQEEFEDFLKENNVAKIMFDNGWGFMGSSDKIDLHCQADEVINSAVNLIEKKKFQKKIAKDSEKGIVFGTDSNYTARLFKLPLKAILLMKTKDGVKGRDFLQSEFDKVKANLKEGQRILNTNLEELGIKI